MSNVPTEHEVTTVWNGGTGAKPSAYFLDCTCGWGMDAVTSRRELADEYAHQHGHEEERSDQQAA